MYKEIQTNKVLFVSLTSLKLLPPEDELVQNLLKDVSGDELLKHEEMIVCVVLNPK